MEAFFHDRDSITPASPTATEVVVSTMGAQGSVLLRKLTNESVSDRGVFIAPSVLDKAPVQLRTFRLTVQRPDGSVDCYEAIRCSAWPMRTSTVTEKAESSSLDTVVDTTGKYTS